jgi:hypothetical protein
MAAGQDCRVRLAAADHGPGRLGGWLRDQPESAAAVAADHSGQRPATATGA